MKRDLKALQSEEYDILVVGGGVHGACVARDAALRGLSVALIEQGDFSCATSHNSLKTIHGGIRYLQHLNIKRAVESIREQDIFLRTAPHLVQPLPFLMPCYGWAMRGPLVSAMGVVLYEGIGLLTRLFSGRRARKPEGGVRGVEGTLTVAPGLDTRQLTGGAIWMDAQVSLADKAVLQMLQQASQHRAVIANHTKALRPTLSREDQRVTGVHAEDALTGAPLTIQARVVVNAAGPWVNTWLANEASLQRSAMDPDLCKSLNVGLVKSMNVLLSTPAPSMAFGVRSARQSDSKVDAANRLFFAVPWLGKTIIGTTHFTHTGDSRTLVNDPAEVEAFINEFSAAYPLLNISMDDVLYCYQGLTPGDDAVDAEGAKLHHSKVIDHRETDKVSGLVSIIGIKWTTARRVAEQATDTAMKQLGTRGRCVTHLTPLPDDEHSPHLCAHLSDEKLREFVLIHISQTQALRLADIVLRRTNDLILNALSAAQVRIVLDTMAAHFQWSTNDQRDEVNVLMEASLGPCMRQALTREFKEFL